MKFRKSKIQVLLLVWSEIENLRGDFYSNFSIGKDRGPRIETQILSELFKIFYSVKSLYSAVMRSFILVSRERITPDPLTALKVVKAQ